jgi:hypothetical protein
MRELINSICKSILDLATPNLNPLVDSHHPTAQVQRNIFISDSSNDQIILVYRSFLKKVFPFFIFLYFYVKYFWKFSSEV